MFVIAPALSLALTHAAPKVLHPEVKQWAETTRDILIFIRSPSLVTPEACHLDECIRCTARAQRCMAGEYPMA